MGAKRLDQVATPPPSLFSTHTTAWTINILFSALQIAHVLILLKLIPLLVSLKTIFIGVLVNVKQLVLPEKGVVGFDL